MYEQQENIDIGVRLDGVKLLHTMLSHLMLPVQGRPKGEVIVEKVCFFSDKTTILIISCLLKTQNAQC